MLYFGYCTLLDFASMKRYAPTAKLKGIAYLADSALAFAAYSTDPLRGGCTIADAPNKLLAGALYELTAGEFQDLDAVSGVHEGWYRRTDVRVRSADGKVIRATTYIIPNPIEPFAPSPEYVAPIFRGAADLKLTREYREGLYEIVRTFQEGSSHGISITGGAHESS